MKTVLINPPSPYLENDTAYAPSGLIYIASAIIENGHECTILDLSGSTTIEWEPTVSSLEADLIGITCPTPNVNIVKRILHTLPKHIPVVIGGPHATFLPHNVLKTMKCDSVVIGEGEVVILDIIKDLEEKGYLKPIYDGGIVDVQRIPKPLRNLVDLKKYRSISVYTSRGCSYSCNFCSKVTRNSFRCFPVWRTLEEIKDLVHMGYTDIVFGDDNISLSRNLHHLLKEVSKFGISFRLNQDARSIDKDTLKLAKDAGCKEISFGVESGSQTILNLMNKKTRIESNERAIKEIQDCTILTKVYLMVNFPGETEETVIETIKFMERTKPDKYLISSFVPLPGSDTFLYPEKYGIRWLSNKWEDFYLVGKDGSFSPCFETEELTCERQLYLHNLLRSELQKLYRESS